MRVEKTISLGTIGTMVLIVFGFGSFASENNAKHNATAAKIESMNKYGTDAVRELAPEMQKLRLQMEVLTLKVAELKEELKKK